MLERRDTGESRDFLPEHAGDLAAGGVVRVQHASCAVRPFDRQRGLAVRIAVERRSPLNQLADVARAALDEEVHRAFVAQAVTGGNRVGGMQLGRIIRADRGGDAALRVSGVAFARLGLRQHEDRAGARQFHGGTQPGDAAPDDEEVCATLHARPDPAILPS